MKYYIFTVQAKLSAGAIVSYGKGEWVSVGVHSGNPLYGMQSILPYTPTLN